MTSHPQAPKYADLHHDEIEYLSESQCQFDVPVPQAYCPYFEQRRSQHDDVHPACHLNMLVGLTAFEIGGKSDTRELPHAGAKLMEQVATQPSQTNSDPPLSNTVFYLFGHPFPECNSMVDIYCPRFQVYPGAADDTKPEFDLGFHNESPTVVHVDIAKSWKGLSSDKAEELLFWETSFRRVLEFLLRDQLELLKQQHDNKIQTLSTREQQKSGHWDRIHYLPISMLDIATAMVNTYREHRRMYHWLASKGNLYKAIAQFVRTHDCFVSPATTMSSFHTPGGLRIGVRLWDVKNYLQGKPIDLSGYPVEVNWASDTLSFVQFDPITAEGHKLCLVPRYNSPLKFSEADGISEPDHIIYKTATPWLRWDASISGFSGTVPFYSSSEEHMMYPEAPLIGGASGEQSKIYTLRIMITATAMEYFDTAVRFERTLRARVTINIKKRKCPQLNPVQHYTLGHVGPENGTCSGVQSSPKWGPMHQPSPKLKWCDDPFIGAGRALDQSWLPSRDPFNSFTGHSLLTNNMDTGLPALSDDDQIGGKNDISPPAPLESALRVLPLRCQRRSSHNLNPLKTAPKLGSRVLPQMKTDHPNHLRTESSDKRLRHDIVNMLARQLHRSQNDEDLEMVYRPWGKRSYLRCTGLPVQMKGNGYLGQDRRLQKNAMLSKANSEEDDEAYISKYSWKMRFGSDQGHPSNGKGRPECNISRTPSSEPLTMDCSRFLNSRKTTRTERDSGMDLPWTPPASDICPCEFEPCRPAASTYPKTRNGADEDVTELTPLVRGKDKASFVRMSVGRAEEERRTLGSDIGDIFDASLAPTSEDDWEGVDTDEEGVSIPDGGDSDEEQTNEGVPILIPGSSVAEG
ncbi:hypothetical protein ACJ72_02894 [Emergomyces africanus]|uniref:Uncharacterized protein n=1 Tax=Emergomyces africanus TaxID=1955775 RepID=A0A1B7P1N8_9EURO|nr:hypothetical protein ACJ72_02894 [Emergomyces africanus]